MARISQSEAQGWAELTKLTLPSLALDALLPQIETEVIARLNSIYDTSGWTNDTTTPAIVRVVIAKMYVAYYIDRQYSENQDETNDYATLLRTNADMLMEGLIDGTIDIPNETPVGAGIGPSFYPNDASSAQEPTLDDPSLGPAKFSMGKIF